MKGRTKGKGIKSGQGGDYGDKTEEEILILKPMINDPIPFRTDSYE